MAATGTNNVNLLFLVVVVVVGGGSINPMIMVDFQSKTSKYYY